MRHWWVAGCDRGAYVVSVLVGGGGSGVGKAVGSPYLANRGSVLGGGGSGIGITRGT